MRTPPTLYSLPTWIVVTLILPIVIVAIGGIIAATTEAQSVVFDGQHLWWLGAAGPVAGLLFLWGVRGKRRAMRAFSSSQLAPLLVERLSSSRSALRAGMVVSAVLLIVAGIIGPRWGTYLEKQRVRGVDVVVALDVSRSMLADDVAPNRLERAKQVIRQQLVERDAFKRANRLGLVAFAGSASMRLPLTTDQLAFKTKLELLNVGAIPRGGTAIGEAINRCVDLFSKSPQEATRVVLLFTDGEDHEGDPVAAAQTAWTEHGVRVYTIGVGDPTRTVGSQLPSAEGGPKKPLLHDGQIVFSKLDEAALRGVAQAGDGRYVQLAGVPELVTSIANLQQAELTTEERIRRRPQYQWFLAAAILLLLLEPMVSESKPVSAGAPRRVWQLEGAS